ncbi:MAG: lactonase family protein [Bacteroidales bacterium]|nr:lactonase family protein [Bacteroidales bacterium]
MQKNNTYSFYVGTYTDKESQGIYEYLLKEDGTIKRIGLSALSENPSFLAMTPDKKFLLAVNETNQKGSGAVESFLVKGDSLSFISRSSSGGAHPCFVTINEQGFVLAANYTGGNLGLLRMDEEGELTDLLDVEQHNGSGTTQRQEGPHAHSVYFMPGSDRIISADLGTNELWFSHLDTVRQKLLPSDPQKIKMAPGAGPRHLAFHPNGNWIYVLNELDCTVTMLQTTNEDKYVKGGSVSCLPSGYTGHNTAADINISSDGKFLYVSNRGHNSIAMFRVNAHDGSLSLIGFQSCHGDGPRNFSLSPDEKHLLVANRYINNIVSFKRDKSTGQLEYVHQIDAPTPVCVLFKSAKSAW